MPKAVEVFGTGPGRAVALHCSLARASAWAPLGARLGDLLTIHAPDLPGHGDAAPWSPEAVYHDQALAIVADAVGEGPVDLLGHSYGAVLALAFAVANPSRVRSLILYEPVLFAAIADGDPAVTGQLADHMGRVEALRAQGDCHGAAQLFTQVWGGAQSWDNIPAQQQQYLADRIHLIHAGRALLYDDAGGVLVPGALARVTAPCLLLNGDHSPPSVAAIQKVLAKGLPNAQRAVVKGGAHMAPITRSAAVAELVRPFLEMRPL